MPPSSVPEITAGESEQRALKDAFHSHYEQTNAAIARCFTVEPAHVTEAVDAVLTCINDFRTNFEFAAVLYLYDRVSTMADQAIEVSGNTDWNLLKEANTLAFSFLKYAETIFELDKSRAVQEWNIANPFDIKSEDEVAAYLSESQEPFAENQQFMHQGPHTYPLFIQLEAITQTHPEALPALTS